MEKTPQYRIQGICYDPELGENRLSGGKEVVHGCMIVCGGRVIGLVEDTEKKTEAPTPPPFKPWKRCRYRRKKGKEGDR